MPITLRLLSTYKGFKPQSIITVDDATAAQLLAGGVNATLTLTGGTVAYLDAPYVGNVPAPASPGPRTLTANQNITLRVPASVVLNLVGSGDVLGTIETLTSTGATATSVALQPGTTQNIGPYDAETMVRVSVTTGTLSMKPSTATTVSTTTSRFDEKLARTNSAKRAETIYSYLPALAPFGRQLAAGGVYYDSTYAGNDSDGTIDRPFKTLEGVTFSTPGQVVNLKRGSVFFITAERYQVCIVTAPNVTFRAYGDEQLQPPLITGLKEVTGFTLASGEYSATFTLTLGQNCMAITYGDNLAGVLPLGTAGSLASGQAAWSANKVYLKDNPGTRKVYASGAANCILVQAGGFRMDGVHCGYTSNNTIAFIPPSGVMSDVAMRDTATWYAGNNGISGSNATNVVLIRHQDTGAYNNAISGINDDSFWYVIEPYCTGKTRKAAELIAGKTIGGYFNDGVTAHGTGLGAWVVVGGVINNVKENGVDIIGGVAAGNINIHKDSIVDFNRINNCGEPGVLIWSYGAKVRRNFITDCGQDGIRLGNQSDPTAVMNQEASYNFIKGCCTNTALGGASGVGPVWGGTWIHHNTMVITAASTRTAHGSLNVATLPSLRIENNLYVLERDGLGVITTSSSSINLTKYVFKGNVFIIPTGNVTVPFTTGGSPRTFAQWTTDVEASARSFADNTAAGITGATYAPNIDSPLATSLAASQPSYDLNARFVSDGVGASAVAENQ